MKQYKVEFWLNGKCMKTTISANGYWQAKEMIQSMYPNATSINVTEIR